VLILTFDVQFEKLYERSKHKKKKLEEMQLEQIEKETKEFEECTFKPQTNAYPR